MSSHPHAVQDTPPWQAVIAKHAVHDTPCWWVKIQRMNAISHIRGMTITFTNSPPCARCGSSGP